MKKESNNNLLINDVFISSNVAPHLNTHINMAADSACVPHTLVQQTASMICTPLSPLHQNLAITAANGEKISPVAETTIMVAGTPLSALVFKEADLAANLLSISQHCEQFASTFTFDKGSVSIAVPGKETVLFPRQPGGLYLIPAVIAPPTSPVALLNKRFESIDERIKWFFHAFGAPAWHNFIDKLERGFFSCPGVTLAEFKAHPQHSQFTDIGRLQQTPPARKSQGKKSGRTTSDPLQPKGEKANVIAVKYRFSKEGKCYSDAAGKFPVRGVDGDWYLVVFYLQDDNYCHFEVMKDRTKESFVRAYTRAIRYFARFGRKVCKFIIDNECSDSLKNFLVTNDIGYQFVPPDIHRSNIAERLLGQVKPFVITMLASADKTFPMCLWSDITVQLEIVFNVMREAGRSPNISAWHDLRGERYDYMHLPLAPFGTIVMAHVKPDKRSSWGAHATRAVYIGPSLDHHRCYRVRMEGSLEVRIVDTVSWHSDKFRAPMVTPSEHFTAVLSDLANAFTRMVQQARLSDDQLVAKKDNVKSVIDQLRELHEALAAPSVIGQNADASSPAAAQSLLEQQAQPPPPQPTPGQRVDEQRVLPPPPAAPQRVVEQQQALPTPAVAAQRVAEQQQVPPPLESAPQRVEEIASAKPSAGQQKAAKLAKRKKANASNAKKANKEEENDKEAFLPVRSSGRERKPNHLFANVARAANQPSLCPLPRSGKPEHINKRNHHGWGFKYEGARVVIQSCLPAIARYENAFAALARCTAEAAAFQQHNLFPSPPPSTPQTTHFTNDALPDNLAIDVEGDDWVLNHTVQRCFALAANLTMRQALASADKDEWKKAAEEEIDRLIDGTETMRAVEDKGQPASYYNPQTKVKYHDNGDVKQRRVRGTYGGDRHYSATTDRSAQTAPMEQIKILFASVVSDKAKYGDTVGAIVVDVKDAYLNSKLDKTCYMRIRLNQLSQASIDKHGLAKFAKNGSVLFAIDKGIYGHPEAGRLWQRELIDNCLTPAGFRSLPSAPCLFTNEDKSVVFSLVVDDFFVKYRARADAEPLLEALRARYTITQDESASKYLGLSLDWEKAINSMSISLPGYINDLIERIDWKSDAKAHAPACVAELNKKTYSRGPQMTEVDSSEPLDEKDTLFVQTVIGALLYYSRAVDPTMITAVNHIATSGFTQKSLAATDHLLLYAQTHSTAHIRFIASDMIVRSQCDASYNGRPKGRSTQGSLVYLGDLDHPAEINGAVECFSSIISVVCASAAEAEYAALFQTAKVLLPIRSLLNDLGYQQPPTLIMCDNAVAVKLANQNMVEKMSKTFDVRFHWIQDRIQQGQFAVVWRKGAQNLADIFTKLLPVSQHTRLAKHLVWYSDEQKRTSIIKRAASRQVKNDNYFKSLSLDNLDRDSIDSARGCASQMPQLLGQTPSATG